MHVLAKQDLSHLIDDEDHAEAQQHLGQMVAAVHALDEHVLQSQPENEGNRHAAHQYASRPAEIPDTFKARIASHLLPGPDV